MIALLCSVQVEAELLLARTGVRTSGQLGSKTVTEGTLAGSEIVLCVGGMGKVNAAHATTLLLTKYDPEVLLVFGIGGAYPSSGAAIGDIAVAKEEIAGDEGVLTNEGFKDTAHIGIPLLKTATSKIYNTFPAPEALLNRSLQTLRACQNALDNRVLSGAFVTLSTCTGTKSRAQELEERYHSLCENMEGAAAAQIATFHGVPWLEMRGISNIVENRDLGKWDIPRAAHAAQIAVIHLLEGWTR